MESRSLLEEIAWSRNAAAHRALLPPSPAASPLAASVHAPEVARPQLKVTSAAGQNGPPEQPPQQPQYPAPPPQQQPPQQPQQQSETLPEGLGREILNRACSLCHSPNIARLMHFLTKTEYANVVSFERGRGAPVSETEFPVLVDYLFENLGKK